MNFFDGPLLISWLDQEVKDDMSDQYYDSLGCVMSKLENVYGGRNGTHFQLSISSVKQFELSFSKIVKLE